MDAADRLQAVLEAFATGDAMGMGTEFMTRSEIRQTIGSIDSLLDSSLSKNHSDLAPGTITDDTEQNLYLMKAYLAAGTIDEPTTTAALLEWIEQSDAVAKRYIGPSSLRALKAIAAGADPHEAGRGGTTCGGLMRTMAAVLCTSADASDDVLATNIQQCLLPTHNTSQALEAACAYGFALRAALHDASLAQVVARALQGATAAYAMAPYVACAASSASRIKYLVEKSASWNSDDELLDFLFGVFGTGLESADVCAAVFALFLRYPDSPWKAIKLAAAVGGDTDTIAALAGALCAAHACGHDIPAGTIDTIARVNGIDFAALAGQLGGKHR